MLYIREENGMYRPASEDHVFQEANDICNARLNFGEFIGSSSDAEIAIAWKLRNHAVEVFACQFLASDHRCLGFEEICRGTINVNVVYPREVVKAAFRHDAAAVIFAHNHPSGNQVPSDQDIALTHALINVLEPLRIQVLDHLIVGDQVTSLADLGVLKP